MGLTTAADRGGPRSRDQRRRGGRGEGVKKLGDAPQEDDEKHDIQAFTSTLFMFCLFLTFYYDTILHLSQVVSSLISCVPSSSYTMCALLSLQSLCLLPCLSMPLVAISSCRTLPHTVSSHCSSPLWSPPPAATRVGLLCMFVNASRSLVAGLCLSQDRGGVEQQM
jgi:hypothetical protein